MGKILADLIVDASENNADLRYLSGFSAPDEWIWFRTAEYAAIMVSELEFERARQEAKPGVRVLKTAEFGPPGAKTHELLENLGRRLHLDGFHVPYRFPAGLAVQLKKSGFELKIATTAFAPEREWKNADEIAQIRLAMAVTEMGMQAALDAIAAAAVDAEGRLVYCGELLSSERLRAIIDSTLAAHDACGIGTIAAAGVQSACPHCRGVGAIMAGVPIVIDIFPRLNRSGYFGDLTRTVVKGHASDTVRCAFDAVRQVRDECKTFIRPGVAASVSYEHALARLTELGFPTSEGRGFFHGLGHGVGLEIHEMPRLSPRQNRLLKGGEVVTVEPGVYYPEWGGVRLEDLVLVGTDGAETITRMATELEIP